MKKKHLPNRYRNFGLHIWCTRCKKTVTNNPCNHSDKQRFQSRIYNPHTRRQDCIKTHDTNDPKEAFEMHRAYRQELELTKFRTQKIVKQPAIKYETLFLKQSAQLYIDYLQDIDVPDFEKKNLTKQHIKDQSRYVVRFLESVSKIEGRISSFSVQMLTKTHVAGFDQYVKDLGLSDTSYNAHIKAVKYFLDYLIKDLKIDFENPFHKIKLKELIFSPEIVTLEEFEKLLSVITPENGIGTRGQKKIETVQYYRPWLKTVFKFSLLIGERLDGIVNLRWKDVQENFIAIPNWKVNRLKNTEQYYSYTPITADLADLLIQLEMKDPDDFMILPDVTNRNYLKSFITKSFSHYWEQTGIKKKGKVTFKNLRKTYITQMVNLLGEKARFIKHTNDKTMIKHYLAEKELLSDLRKVKIYDFKD